MSKVHKYFSLILAVLILVGGQVSCLKLYADGTGYSVEVDFDKTYLCIGESYTPAVIKSPSNLSVNWRSSNPGKATVTSDGTITGVSVGFVTIRLTYIAETGNPVYEYFNICVVDALGLENNTSYYIANSKTGRLLAADVEHRSDYGNVVTLLNNWTDKSKWKIIPSSNGAYKLYGFSGQGTIMKRFGTNIEVETEEGISDERFYIYRVTEGDNKGTYRITNGDLYVAQDGSNNVCLVSDSNNVYSYWSFMKVEKGYAEIFAFDYPEYNSIGPVTNFINTFYDLDFDTSLNINSTPEYALESLVDWDDIFVFRGHGNAALLAFMDEYGDSNGCLVADSMCGITGEAYISQIAYNGLSSVRCALYLGCLTGVSYNGYDLLNSTYDKGAHFVLGTLMEVYADDSDDFLRGFLLECAAGGTIGNSVEHGILEAGIEYDRYGNMGRYPITYVGDGNQRLKMS